MSAYLKRLLEQTIHIGFQDIEDKMLCGDLLFSGHTLVMIVSAYTVSYYLPTSKKWLGYFPKLFALIGMICMIISRTHYTIDVVFAYWLSLGVFTLYHAYTEIDTYRERKNSALSQWWFIRVFVSWLEENVIPGRIENEFDIPLIPKIYKKFMEPSSKRAQAGDSNTMSTASSEMGIENV
uniref:Sphingomyelin synthase-like domain-containing protein n=1 Tax=Acrobeloides nanus TaxID=290746 RepID=A0A914CCS0_9BILA